MPTVNEIWVGGIVESLYFLSICLVNLLLRESTEGSSSCEAAFSIAALTFSVIDPSGTHPVTRATMIGRAHKS
jgi:hypothetical protein